MKLGRKIVHLILSFLSIIIALTFGKNYVIFLILCLIFGIYSKYFDNWTKSLWELYDKTGRRITPLLYGASVLSVYLIFDVKTAVISVMVLGVGDTVSAIIGSKFGKNKYPYSEKSIEGSIAGIVVSSLILLSYTSLKIALLSSIIGMIIESFDWPDDNPPIVFGTAFFLSLLNL